MGIEDGLVEAADQANRVVTSSGKDQPDKQQDDDPEKQLDPSGGQIEASSVSEGTAHGRRTMSEFSKVATMAKGNRSSSRQSATSSGWTP